MNTQNTITDKNEFQKTASHFFTNLFEEVLKKSGCEISIETPNAWGAMGQSYHDSVSSATDAAYQLCQNGKDVYVGVNSRVGRASTKENVHWLSTFHADIDYGSTGHKKESKHSSYEEALEAIANFGLPPTMVIHSGGGFHCYWVLNRPAQVEEIGKERIEAANKALTIQLRGDVGTQNINRILRVPGTFNFKNAGNPREVTIVIGDGPKYDIEQFAHLLDAKPATKPKEHESTKPKNIVTGKSEWDQKILSLPVSAKIKNLIIGGNDGSYPSRSEADQAVTTALVNKGMSDADIKSIFENYGIGEKYREHSSPDTYLQCTINKAKEYSNLTEEERQDPLFISGSLHKDDKNKIHIKTVRFQEYMNKKHMLKFLEKERAFFGYNGKCYEGCSEDRLNNLCQSELGSHRELFTPGTKSSFIHFAIGDDLVDAEKAFDDQVRYLTMQNGLYDLHEGKLIPHTPKIFTTNLLPYDYDPEAQCPRWLKYLDEVFMSDAATIKFVQEAVGYAFHKSIPKAAMFFLIGDGGNGKSVFIFIISGLCGKENISNISLNRLNDEKYLPELFGKMINVSGETPSKKCINTDLVKSVVAGDWVTGREVYKKPTKFKPYAKHYLGMNTLPDIEDNTDGMWRRIYVIPFPRKFSEAEMDVRLTERLMGELSGIFNWALEGHKRLKDRDFIFSSSSTMQRSKKQYKYQNNSALEFIATKIASVDPDHSMAFKDMYDLYAAFCTIEKHKNILSKRDFRKTLNDEGFIVENSSKHANQVRVFGAECKMMF